MSASSPVHRIHVDAKDGELIHLTVNDADYFLGVGSNTVLLPRTCEPIMLDTEDPQIDITQLIWHGSDHTPEP